MKLVARRPGIGVLLSAMAFLLLFLIAGCGGRPGLTISVAVSLGDAMEEIAAEFERLEGVDVDLNLGASNVLARQVELGAPVDLVVLAGLEPVDELIEEGFVSRDGVAEILGNSLAVVSKSKNGKAAPLADLASLAADYTGRIAIADPQLAPAGVYADAALQAAGVAADLEGRIIPALDVRAAAAAVESGHAEFGIVYSTDALAFDGIAGVLEIPADLHPPIVYPAAVISGSDSEQLALRFLLFLQGEFAGSVFRSHGFVTSNSDGR
ncbi:MAG: molybdate ABC transporter substrate-binding protein [Chloroflexi bacterium]|nr:molybdate ABC transporter substrate-binding protein [Chloroflexota bacterium]MCH8223964.1 molybdate ABC transporter substrate-binding protein [Chloroflexota bacterium]